MSDEVEAEKVAWGSPLDRAGEALAAHRTRLEGWARVAWRAVHEDVRQGYVTEAKVALTAYCSAEAVEAIAEAIHEADVHYSWDLGRGPVGDWRFASDEMRERRRVQALAALHSCGLGPEGGDRG